MSSAMHDNDAHDVEIMKGLIIHYSELTACYLDNVDYFTRTGKPIAADGYKELAEHEMHREAVVRNKLFDLGVVLDA